MTRGILSHIEINVSNLENAAAFWGWFLSELGYAAYQKWPQGQSWKCGECYFVIVQAEAARIENGYHRKNVGLNHLAFHASSAGDVDDMTAKLKARNVTILYPERHPHAGGSGHYAVFFEDPDRIKVEFVASHPTVC